MYKAFSASLKISFLALACLFSINSKSLAQVTSDRTVNTQVNQNGNNAEITGGETRGDNLFHSFQEFSIPTGNEAFFNNANEISNIFSRVTGGNISNIDGLIRANDANLFLINPAGILFGAGARLDLGGGSFYGSSADSILFEDGEFSATDLDNPVLTINAPIGLNFRDNPADITIRGDGLTISLPTAVEPPQNGLTVAEDATLGIVGGNLIFEGATIATAGGRIDLGSVGGGRVDLVAVENGFNFDYAGVDTFQDISLSDSSNIDASGGSILEPGAAERADTAFSLDANVGDIVINTGTLLISEGSTVSVNVSTATQGEAGNIFINATDSIVVRGFSTLLVPEIDGTGSIIGNEEISIASQISSGVGRNGIGNGGNIEITTPRLSVLDGGQILSTTFGQGNAGNLIINASQSIELDGLIEDGSSRSGLFSSALEENGNGGNLQIFTQDLVIRNGATINVSNFPSVEGLAEVGTGEAGNLTVEADSLRLESGGRINAATQAGNGGNINLNIADDITLQGGVFISASAMEDANGGNINIDTNFIVAFPNGNNDIIANAEQGNGGNISINAESLFGIEERPLNSLTNDINATSEFSLDGSVTINTPDISSFQAEMDLSQNIMTPEQNTAQACNGSRRAIARNSFTIKGKGGIPVKPSLPLNSQNIFINGESSNSISATPQVIETSQGEIKPARGIKVTQSRKIILTAYRTNNSGERIFEIQRNCG